MRISFSPPSADDQRRKQAEFHYLAAGPLTPPPPQTERRIPGKEMGKEDIKERKAEDDMRYVGGGGVFGAPHTDQAKKHTQFFWRAGGKKVGSHDSNLTKCPTPPSSPKLDLVLLQKKPQHFEARETYHYETKPLS